MSHLWDEGATDTGELVYAVDVPVYFEGVISGEHDTRGL